MSLRLFIVLFFLINLSIVTSACEDSRRVSLGETQEVGEAGEELGEIGGAVESMGGMEAGRELEGGTESLGGLEGGLENMGGVEGGGEAMGGDEGGHEERPLPPQITQPLHPSLTWWIEGEPVHQALSFGDGSWLILTDHRMMTRSSSGQISPIWFDVSPQSVIPLNAIMLTDERGQQKRAIVYVDGVWAEEEQVTPEGETISQWRWTQLSASFEQIFSVVSHHDKLWINDQTGVSLWSSGQLSRFESLAHLSERHLMISRWAQGSQATTDAEENQEEDQEENPYALWLWAEDELHVIAHQSLLSHPTWNSEVPVVTDGVHAWGLKQGQLWGGIAGEPWHLIELPFLTNQMWSESSTEGALGALWLLSEEQLWRYQANTISFAPIEGRWWGGGVDPTGRLLLWGAQGMVRVDWQRSAEWRAERLLVAESSSIFTLRVDDPAEVTRAESWVVKEGAEGLGEPERTNLLMTDWQVSFSNQTLNEGRYLLFAEVEYNGGELIETSLSFSVSPLINWSDDVSPIYSQNCVMCHDGQGGARDLNGAEQWETSIDEILFVTRMQSMPIGRPPLTPEQTSLIEAWKLGGFQE